MGNLVRNRPYGFVLLVETFLFFITPFARERPILFWLFILGLFGILVAVILTIWRARLPRLLGIGSAAVALTTGFLASPSLQFVEPDVSYLTVCCVAFASFILIAIVSIGVDVLFRQRVTVDCILGSICVYLFLGMFFAFVFGLLTVVWPGSFHHAVMGTSLRPITLNDLLYFSFSTLTTTGYGDITPTHPFVRTLAISESIVGTLYIAIMITRLVGLHVADRDLAKP